MLSEACAFEQLAELRGISVLIHVLAGSRSPSSGEDCGSTVITTTTNARIQGSVRYAIIMVGCTSIAVGLVDLLPVIGVTITITGIGKTILGEITLTGRVTRGVTRSLPTRTSQPETRNHLTDYEIKSESEPMQ